MSEADEARSRVAIALDAAERVVSRLPQRSRTYERARKALADARKWAEGEAIPARQLYDHIHPLTELAEDDGLMGREVPAFNAVLYALYYVTWHADGEEAARNDRDRATLGNDICEVNESVFDRCLAYAEEAERP